MPRFKTLAGVSRQPLRGNRFLAAAELAEFDAFVAERPGDVFADRWLCGGAEAGKQIIVGGNRLLAAAELAEFDALAAERPGQRISKSSCYGDVFADRRLCGGAVAGKQIVAGGSRFLATAELASSTPLLQSATAMSSRIDGSVAEPKRASKTS